MIRRTASALPRRPPTLRSTRAASAGFILYVVRKVAMAFFWGSRLAAVGLLRATFGSSSRVIHRGLSELPVPIDERQELIARHAEPLGSMPRERRTSDTRNELIRRALLGRELHLQEAK